MSRWPKFVCFTLLALIVSAAAALAQETTVEVVGGDEDTLRRLLARVVAPLYFAPAPGSEPLRITVGALPDDLPFAVPVPQDAEILGGMANISPVGAGQLYLNAGGASEDVLAFFAEALEADGWYPAPVAQPTSGFIPTQPETQTYCSADGQTVMTITAQASGEATTAINLYWQEAYPGACEDSPAMQGGVNPVIPGLRLPPGVQMTGGSSGGGNDDSFILAMLVTEMSAGELGEFYSEQLSEQGWELTGEGNTDVTAASTWTITDDAGNPWLGVLMVVDAGENRKTAFFQASRTAS
ncbi:MAG: hypothetical protein DIU68_009485 [Chloroflexota bacterium]